MKNGFFKGHGLGNDYIAVDPKELDFKLTPGNIRKVCDRNWGVGSDGILALEQSKKADYGLRIYNPDGSEAEKSGNGLRIFARYLYSTRRTRKKQFTVETKGGLVAVDLHTDEHGNASAATVEMGQATFRPGALPCSLPVDELVQQPIRVAGRSLIFTGVSVGNPHCVIFRTKGQAWTRSAWVPRWRITRSSHAGRMCSSPFPLGPDHSTSSSGSAAPARRRHPVRHPAPSLPPLFASGWCAAPSRSRHREGCCESMCAAMLMISP